MKANSQTKVAVVAAILVGLFALIAVRKYVASKTEVAPVAQATILAVTQEIREGAEIGAEMLTVKEIPFEALSNIHITLPSRTDPAFAKAFEDAKAKIVGRRVKRIVAADTPIFWIDVDTAPKVPFADLIGDGNRAVTMPVDSLSSACGFIRPGSRVDVVLTAAASKLGLLIGNQQNNLGDGVVTYVILQNVPVVATDRLYDLQGEPDGYGTITMNLPLKAALMMVQARTMGQITYLLRNVRDTVTEPDRTKISIAPGQSFGEAIRQFEK